MFLLKYMYMTTWQFVFRFNIHVNNISIVLEIAFKFVVLSLKIELNAIPSHAVDETFTTPVYYTL